MLRSAVILLVVMVSRVDALDISHLGLTEVPTNISREETSVILSHNQISRIGTYDFANMSNLVELRLDYNNIFVIEPESLWNILRLEHLDLRQNKITSFPDVSFLGSLNYLDVGRNPLPLYEVQAIGEHPQIETLIISDSDMHGTLILPTLRMLKTFRCRSNHMEALTEGVFEGFNKLKRVNLSNNKLSSLPYLGSGTLTIGKINLTKNWLYHVPNLNDFVSLEEIDLSENFISIIPNEPLLHAPACTIILDYNPVICAAQLCWITEQDWPFSLSFLCQAGVHWQEMAREMLCHGRLWLVILVGSTWGKIRVK